MAMLTKAPARNEILLTVMVDRLIELGDENRELKARLDERADADAQRVVDKLFEKIFDLSIENERMRAELAELRELG